MPNGQTDVGGVVINLATHITDPKGLNTGLNIALRAESCVGTQDQPRAQGHARVAVKKSEGMSRLAGLHQAGALKLLFPQGRPPLEAVMVNTAGGITGGDRFSMEARAGADARLCVTTQAAERAYRAQIGQEGRMDTHLIAEPGAAINWLPQETILFQASAFRRRLRADLAADSRLLLVEPLVFGRAAMGEELTQADFDDRIEIFRAGQRLYHDAVRLSGNISATLARPAIGGGLSHGVGALATVVLAAPEAEAALEWIRAALPQDGQAMGRLAMGGASLLAPDLLHCRLLAQDSFILRQSLLPILDRLTEGGLPRCWRL